MFAPIRPTPTNPIFMSLIASRQKMDSRCFSCRLLSADRDPGRESSRRASVRIFSQVILQRVVVGDGAAAHRTGKERIAHDRHRPRESTARNRSSRPREWPDVSSVSIVQRSDLEALPFRRSPPRHARIRVRRCKPARLCRTAQRCQICDVIRMRVRQQDKIHMLNCSPRSRASIAVAVGAGIERDCLASSPDPRRDRRSPSCRRRSC